MTALLFAIAPLVRAIVGHIKDHDATVRAETATAARLLGVAPEALDRALREALREGGLVALIGGQQAEIEALRAELHDLAAGMVQTSEEAASACADLSRAMRSVLPARGS